MSGFAPPWDDLREMVRRAVAEDLPAGDPTGASLAARPAKAFLVAREAGTVAGLVAAQSVLDEVDRHLGCGEAKARLFVADGDRVHPGDRLAELDGPARALVASERTLLNVVTHLSGIASATARMVAAVEGTGAVVRDTRKTLPGLRVVEKYAVRCGGGANHRMSLSDAVLVKDNHVAAHGGVTAAVKAARQAIQSHPAPLGLEVEVDNLEQLDEALAAGVGLVLVDNMSLESTAEAVRRAHRHGAKVEASGGIGLDRVALVAGCGVDYVAVGALTHSAPALDMALDWYLDV